MKLHHLNHQCIYETSKYFTTIDDFCNVEMAAKRFRGNIDKFTFNPIVITPQNRHLFTHLQTLYLFNLNSYLFPKDEKIIERIYVNPIECQEYKKLQSQKRNMITFKDITFKPDKENNTIMKTANSLSPFGFANSYLSPSIIPTTITKIGRGCFLNCANIRSMMLPSTITYLEDEVFMNCSNLTAITLFSTLKSIGKRCFKKL